MNKEKYFIDLSKLSEEQRKHIFSLLPPETEEDDYEITDNCRYLRTVSGIWMVTFQTNGRTELTYPDFIKLFEGGEPIKSDQTQIEKLEAEKKELWEALDKAKQFLNYVQAPATPAIRLRMEIESLIQKHKQ